MHLTIYDAAYVALAELVDAKLVTADRRIERASGTRCSIEILACGWPSDVITGKGGWRVTLYTVPGAP
jgi:hypothetical protein